MKIAGIVPGRPGTAIDFEPRAHVYRRGTREVVSVTQALRLTGLSPNYGTEADRFRGTAVHRACELYDQGKLDVDSAASVAGWLAGWKQFRAETRFEPVYSEAPLFHPAHEFAGTPDVIGKMGRRWWVIDRKTVNEMTKAAPWVAYQTAGYAILAAYAYATPALSRGAVVLSADGRYRLFEHRGAGDSARLLSAVNVCNARRELYGRFDDSRIGDLEPSRASGVATE